MNKLARIIAGVLLACQLPLVALADMPIRLESTNFGLESFFFGSTGVVYSYSASIPPVITSGPTVVDITQTTVRVIFTVDKPTIGSVLLGTSSGNYDG